MTHHTPTAPSILEGRLERITFVNPETHYTVAVIVPHRSQNPVTVVGFMAALHPGENLKISGAWETHPRFGQQFKVSSYTTVLPDASEDIRKYLASGIIKGIGPATAQRLVDRFGPDTLEIIAQHQNQVGAHRRGIPKIAMTVAVALRVTRVRGPGEVDDRKVGRVVLPAVLHDPFHCLVDIS